MKEEIISSGKLQGEDTFEETLRPQRLNEFIGQDTMKENLHIFIESARRRDDVLDHVLLFGPPGLGKTTLAHIIANEMKVDIIATSGPVLERPGDLAGLLTKLKKGDVFFIDEIHRINRVVEEYLYSAIEDFIIDIMIDSGPSARSVKLNLKPFTLIGATTRSGLLTGPMRSRFGIMKRLDFYNDADIGEILKRSANILNIEYEDNGVKEIACRSRGTPRIANRLLKRVRDYAVVKGRGVVDKDIALSSMDALGVDSLGLDDVSVSILKAIIEKYNGGPVGISTIAVSIGETGETIEEVYEPFLILKGMIKRTPRGRVVTDLAYEHLGMKKRGNSLF